MTTPERFAVLNGGATPDERETRLSEGADALIEGTTRPSIFEHNQFLLVVAATLMTSASRSSSSGGRAPPTPPSSRSRCPT